jgi:hypothetical protein
MSLPLRDPDRHTCGESCTWPGDQRHELIDGMAYAMAPAPTRQHQRLAFELAREVADALEGSGCLNPVVSMGARGWGQSRAGHQAGDSSAGFMEARAVHEGRRKGPE